MLPPCQHEKLARGAQDKEHAMSQTANSAIAVIGIDIGKNSFHVVGHDARGASAAAPDPKETWAGLKFRSAGSPAPPRCAILSLEDKRPTRCE